MHELRVGQPYHPGRQSWPEVAQYQHRGGGHELLLCLACPTGTEVEAVRRGEAEFALYAHEDLIVLLYRFGAAGRGIPWSDAPYSWHLVPAGERALPPDVAGNERALLTVVLVDAATGIIRALRVVSWSPAFTAAVHAAIRAQAARPWSEAVYDAALDLLYARYPTTGALLERAVARTTGGTDA